jgi:hypothetical protein
MEILSFRTDNREPHFCPLGQSVMLAIKGKEESRSKYDFPTDASETRNGHTNFALRPIQSIFS